MGRRLLLLLVLSVSIVVFFPEKEPFSRENEPEVASKVDAEMRAGAGSPNGCGGDACFRDGGERDGEFLCGECPNSEPGDDGARWHGSFLPASTSREDAPRRRGPAAVPKQGLGPVRSFLRDTLILSRPPPAVPRGS